MYKGYIEEETYDPIILIPFFIFDFLCIHPFTDGNGRISRLLTLLLLYQSGYRVGKYISLERIIETSKSGYYDALEATSKSWHESKHTIFPWLNHFHGVLIAAYKEFETLEDVKGWRLKQQAAEYHNPANSGYMSTVCVYEFNEKIKDDFEPSWEEIQAKVKDLEEREKLKRDEKERQVRLSQYELLKKEFGDE